MPPLPPEAAMTIRPPFVCFLASILFAVAYDSAPAAGCPENCIWTPGGSDYCTSAGAADTTLTFDPGGLCTATYHASYDIRHGTLSSQAGSPFGGCNPRTTVQDDFTVGGLPSGTLVSFSARLELSMIGSCLGSPGSMSSGIREGASNSAELEWELT